MKPIKTKEYRRFLLTMGCEFNRIKGDHEIWTKYGLKRPIVFPIKDKEISPGIIQSNLRTLGISKEDFLRLIE